MFGSQLALTAHDLNQGHYMEQCIITRSVEDAEDTFVDAKERMLDVNHWNRYSDIAGASFALSDSHNRSVSRRAHKGDHVTMMIPGKDDYCVVIDAIEYDDYPDLGMESFTLRLHPCHDNEGSDEEYDGSKAILIIERRYKNVFAVFEYRNHAGEEMAGGEGCFGLTDDEWNGMLKRFVA